MDGKEGTQLTTKPFCKEIVNTSGTILAAIRE